MWGSQDGYSSWSPADNETEAASGFDVIPDFSDFLSYAPRPPSLPPSPLSLCLSLLSPDNKMDKNAHLTRKDALKMAAAF